MNPIRERLKQGLALHQAGDLEGAEKIYREVLQQAPKEADAWYLLGSLAHQVAQHEVAVQYLERAISLHPVDEAYHNNLGEAYRAMGRLNEAVQAYEVAIQVRPDYHEAHSNLGNACQEMGRLDEAVTFGQLAVKMAPSSAPGHNNLANALLGQGRIDEAMVHYREALRLRPIYPKGRSNFLFALNYDPRSDVQALLAEHRWWGDVCSQNVYRPERYENTRDPERRLRIGYASPDFVRHPVADFFEPILRHHNPEAVEVFLYGEVGVPDKVTERLKSLAHHWQSTCGLNDDQVAGRIYSDQIDILVDLAGHTRGTRIMAFVHKPAPVQVTYLGYPNTTGLTAVDYRLTDEVCDPSGEAFAHAERLVRLDPVFCCYGPRDDAPPQTPLPFARNGCITFGGRHNLAKLNSQVIELWCRVLAAVPGSRLLLWRDALKGSAGERIRAEIRGRGVADERVELRHSWAVDGSHLALYQEIDIALDTFPYSGHTTTCEALWMGVPVVTLLGDRCAGRMSASVLHAAGLPRWIARSPEEYVTLVAQLAQDPVALADWRTRLREMVTGSSLCDAARFTRQLEETYRAMWRRWCETAPA